MLAVIVTILYGISGTTQLLILNQVVLGMQLSFAVFLLVMLTSGKLKTGEFVNPLWRKVLSYTDIDSVINRLTVLFISPKQHAPAGLRISQTQSFSLINWLT